MSGPVLNLEFNGFAELSARVKAMPSKLRERCSAEVESVAQSIVASAKAIAPANVGTLRNRIFAEDATKDPDVPTWRITCDVEYAAFVEFGTLAKVGTENLSAELQGIAATFQANPDGQGLTYSEAVAGEQSAKEAIYAWCYQKGINKKFWWPIYVEIMTQGIGPQPFFFPSVAKHIPEFEKRIEKAVDNALNE